MATTSPAAAGTQLGPGVILKSRWKLVKKIGQGAFGEIYAGVDLEKHESIALKVEKWDNKKAVLKLEVVVLKKMQNLPDGSPNPFVCRYIHCGHYEDYNYLVMELLGENLSDLRRKRPGGRFSLATTSKLGILMLRAIESIHSLGYLHRDIKPSNFAIGLPPHRHKDCVMIDFGLTRKFRLTNGDIRPPREIAGFRGTARYASINSHLSKELSRRDDLWSLLYVLIEFATGHLPWRKLKDKVQDSALKLTHLSAGGDWPAEDSVQQSRTREGPPCHLLAFHGAFAAAGILRRASVRHAGRASSAARPRRRVTTCCLRLGI